MPRFINNLNSDGIITIGPIGLRNSKNEQRLQNDDDLNDDVEIARLRGWLRRADTKSS